MIITAKSKFAPRVKITTPDGIELKNIYSVDFETMFGLENVNGELKSIDLTSCTITILPLKP